MPLVSGKVLFEKANEYNFAIGAFNFNNMEFLKAILDAAEEEQAPVFIQTTESAIKYAGIEYLAGMVHAVKDKYSIPFALHLDHGKHVETILLAIRHGYTSVMIDYSDKSYEENLKVTKYVVSICAALGISVEAELGKLVSVEDEVVSREEVLVDPEQAKEFVDRTGIDALAPAIGTAHGAFKFKGEPKLDFERLKKVKELTGIALVLHGASGVYEEYVEKINKYGGDIKGAKGVPDEELKKAVELGINKVNTDTDLRLAFISKLRELMALEKKVIDPRKFLKPAMEEVKNIVKKRIRLYGSQGKAELFRV
ncbi:class II fructose-1,6-bisphosphate aldolase [Aquifex aeolicus]|uniref:Fructose-1,6-bisphosphate aldolase class II n=1 Tax=Aquifex aeolicus (strain VF5) TaxID=224324 RepID=O67396_AQUAE|nr:class II fructose-1,6-bisphosphate aldolase [Aquifex aeolicus]AAC07345.1 fructose-1,6-bisphosphate aldolase class II [Aquifex aeolicus VF5]